MGIQNLLQMLKSIQRRRHVREYKGLRVAIDAYCWLHKGVYACAYELAKGIRTRKYSFSSFVLPHTLLGTSSSA